MTAALIVGGIVALGLVLAGVVALIAPRRMADAYGAPLDGESGHGFVWATGIRDVVIGVALAATVYFRDVPLLVVLAIAGIVLSLSDLAIAYHASGKRLRRRHAVHFGGAVAFVLVLAMALFAIGR